MLFDHGADSITAVLFGIQILTIFHIYHEDFALFNIIFMVLIPNFVALWNQYSTGFFDLDRINPIDEGIPTYAVFAILAAFLDFTKFNHFNIIAQYNEESLLLIGFGIGSIVIKVLISLFRTPKIR